MTTSMCYERFIVVARIERRRQWLLAGLLACGEDARIDVHHYENVGAICLSPKSGGGSHVQAVLTDCATACARLKASCRAQVAGQTIEVEAEGATTEEIDPQQLCPLFCKPLEARCELPAIPEGTYQVLYGDRSATVEVPVPSSRTEVLPGPDLDTCRTVPELL